MKFCKQVAVLALCILIARSAAAAAEFYDPGGQSNEQSPAPPTKLSAKSLPQLVAAEIRGLFRSADGRALGVASMAAASMVVDVGDSVDHRVELAENSRTERTTMLQSTSIISRIQRMSPVGFAAPFLFALSPVYPVAPTFAQQPGQRTFATAQDAAHALSSAKQTQNEQDLLSIVGPDGKDVISSGDSTEDMNSQLNFVHKYQEMHRFATESDGSVSLVSAAENWPFPIRIVDKQGSWYFDTATGKQEILFRRIGRNEVSAMDACSKLVNAQKSFFAQPQGDLSKQFAYSQISDKGRHNVLYGHDAANESASPIDSLIANASSSGQGGDATPYNGYFFRILASQGTHAPDGAKNDVVDGKMIEGFAFAAYPAENRSSGVMTFIVNESGTLYQKHLGPGTSELAEKMTAYDPYSTWEKAE